MSSTESRIKSMLENLWTGKSLALFTNPEGAGDGIREIIAAQASPCPCCPVG